MKLASVILPFTAASVALAHYTFPTLLVGGTPSSPWQYTRKSNNWQSREPMVDVSSADLRCYNTQVKSSAATVTVAAGSQLGFQTDNENIYHQGVVNVYMAKAPAGTDVANWDGSGAIWFKVYQITPITDGGKSISFPSTKSNRVTFTIPQSVPSGQYLVRMEAIAIHDASYFGGAQFYISCAQINVTGGGNGSPGPLVSFPGAYTGREPGLLIDIYYPIPKNYTQPGPAVWSG